MKDLKVKQVNELYEEVYWKIDPPYGEMNRSEEEAFELDEELFNLIEKFDLKGCDGEIGNTSPEDKQVEGLNEDELGLLIIKLKEFQTKL
jgi:hypothetical protein